MKPYLMNDTPRPNKPKLTPWFHAATQKPVRRGWYDFYDGLWGQHVRAMWSGSYWTWAEGSRIDPYQCDKWRGLAQDPKG